MNPVEELAKYKSTIGLILQADTTYVTPLHFFSCQLTLTKYAQGRREKRRKRRESK